MYAIACDTVTEMELRVVVEEAIWTLNVRIKAKRQKGSPRCVRERGRET
jgi:hypothetical protein